MAIAVHRKLNPEDAARVQSVAWCGRRAEPVRLAAAAGDAHCLSAPWRRKPGMADGCTMAIAVRRKPDLEDAAGVQLPAAAELREVDGTFGVCRAPEAAWGSGCLAAGSRLCMLARLGGLALSLCRLLADAALRREFPNCAARNLAAPFLFCVV